MDDFGKSVGEVSDIEDSMIDTFSSVHGYVDTISDMVSYGTGERPHSLVQRHLRPTSLGLLRLSRVVKSNLLIEVVSPAKIIGSKSVCNLNR